MSAILFNPETEHELNTTTSTTSTHNESSSMGDHFTEVAQQKQRPCSAIYEDILDTKMNGLSIHAIGDDDVDPSVHAPHKGQSYCDGSDSGVEIPNNVNVSLQRALSNQSGGYASSCQGGLDDTAQGINISCNSSMISCSSDVYDAKQQSHSLAGINVNGCRSSLNYECCSENGSESSSIAGPTTMAVRRVSNHNNVKKKVAMFEPSMHESLIVKSKTSSKEVCTVVSTPAQQQNRPRLSGLKRAVSLPRPSHGTAQQVRERLSDKMHGQTTKTTNSNCLTPYRNTQARTPLAKPQKPENLPSQLSRTTSMSMQRLVQRTPSLNRARTPSTPDDGRWPSVNSNSRSSVTRRGLSVTPDLSSMKMRSSMMASMEIKSSSTSPYGTLPRRRKQKSVEDLTGRSSRSSSITRESRMTSSVIMTSRKSLATSYNTSSASTPTQHKTMTSSLSLAKTSTLRKSQTPSVKTRIYHETACQTALTNSDLEKAFAGVVHAARSIESVEQKDQETQTEIRDQEMARLREELRHLAQREQELSSKLKREREEKLAMQRELHMNTEKVMGLLNLARITGNGKILDAGTPTSDEGESNQDSLLMLESQIQMSGHELIQSQQEIGQLRKLCRSLQVEMERSLMQQECLMQEKAAIEQESNELQDFLQHEKAAMCDALKDLEAEYQQCQQQLASKDEEVKVLRDECRHLVRLNEQRRQENRLLQTKYAALESKSKDLIMQQNASVSGATAALTGLHARLDNLVEQLVFSYNISEQDLEDIGFQNDTQTNVSASGENSLDCESTTTSVKLTLNGHEITQTQQQQQQQHPQTLNFAQAQNRHIQQFQQASDGSLSPQRNQSFIAAVISAIRNATTHSGKRLLVRHNKRHSSAGNGGGVHHHHHHHHHHHSNLHNQLNGNNSNCSHNNNNQQNANENNGDDSDSTEMLDSETEPCLMMDNVLEDVPMPDSHSHNMVSSCTGMISQIEIPSEILNVTTADESLQNLSQAIVNRQNMESQVNALSAHKVNLQLNEQASCTEELSCHDSVNEMPSLVEYSVTQAVVDQVIEVDSLVTKLLKVLRLIQLDNDNCIQQLIIDKNKLQQSKEDMLEKIKDLQDVNVKLQDELMDATQELMMKNNDLSNTKAEIQRHRNEIDRLTEDICNLSTLCSNYRKLSPSTELPQFPDLNLTLQSEIVDNQDDIGGIINLLKMWQADGQLKDNRIQKFLSKILEINISKKTSKDLLHPLNERLRIYANQLENILTVLNTANPQLIRDNPALQQLHKDLEVVKLNANWSQLLAENDCTTNSNSIQEDINAN
ncbi:hypothetical protein DOY81_007434 [Sarcophaga bullata]|nr:hypothetical protein DOY81_007434 [Sarcophaga bullata]